MSIPSDRNIALKEIDKKSKYKDLELEIQRMWQMKTEVIPVVVGLLGTIKKGMVENLKRVSERANNNNNNNNNKGTGVGQVGSLAYHGDVDDPAHQSLGWCLWQVPVTPSHPCQGYDKGVGGTP